MKPKLGEIELYYDYDYNMGSHLYDLLDTLAYFYFSAKEGVYPNYDAAVLSYERVKLVPVNKIFTKSGVFNGYTTSGGVYRILIEVYKWVEMPGYYLYHYKELPRNNMIGLFKRYPYETED